MKEYTISVPVVSCQWDELNDSQQNLVRIAKEQTQNSYSPYSHFRVGAALELGDGTIVRGANQENAAYPSGLCAERSALFAAGAVYPDQAVVRLAIACYAEDKFLDEPGSPCGACRQVMVESEQRGNTPMEVILYGEKEILIFKSAKDLLPLMFDGEVLPEV